MAVMGWCGPLIDLSTASSHLDDFVQLIVFVRRSEPVQKLNSLKEDVLKINIQVGDDTRSYFSISIWQKHMGSKIVVGDIILIQNVKIIKFRDVLEASTAQISEVIVLLHSYDLTASKGIDELVALAHFQLGQRAREKLRRVVEWMKHTESAFQHLQHKNRQSLKNWKEDEIQVHQNCLSISEVVGLARSCNAYFSAHIFDVILGFSWRPDEVDKGSVSKWLFKMADNKIVEEFIYAGCKLCGSPMGSRNVLEQEQDKAPLYCPKNTKYLHSVGLIYRPFLLIVEDESGQTPILVHNKAAENLFGGITAENVHKCYQEEQKSRTPDYDSKSNCDYILSNPHPIISESAGLARGNQQFRCPMQADGDVCRKNPHFYQIWLILLRSLLQRGMNSPFRFEIQVDEEKDHQNGRFELVALVMPCYKAGKS